MPLSGIEGWEIKRCLRKGCGYAIENCMLTRNFIYCPLCLRKGIESRLVDRYIILYPEYREIVPLAEKE